MKQKCTNELKKFAHVNKKALDQYMSFTDQRDDLVKRKEELDSGAGSIKDLIAVLDQRKDEAIERTFKGVAKNFSAVFSELVPHGSAELVMLKKRPREEIDEEGWFI
jgi:structural maintenance of chromosome 3 (chondroitin sulfate proteoglycan 6)